MGVILERVNPVIGEAVEILRGRGANVELIQPRQMNFELSDIRICHDLYVIKSIAMPMAASYAATVHALGASTFNPFPVVQMIRNKIATMRLLADHGVPIPETYVGVDYEFLVPLLEHGPIIVKPFMGSRGIGVQRVTNRNELKIAAGDMEEGITTSQALPARKPRRSACAGRRHQRRSTRAAPRLRDGRAGRTSRRARPLRLQAPKHVRGEQS